MTAREILFILYLLVIGSEYGLSLLNMRYLKRHNSEVPAGFEGVINTDLLKKTVDYTLAKERMAIVESTLDAILLIFFLFAGLLVFYDRWIASLWDSFVGGGMLFFLFLTLAQTLIAIPFDLYGTFRVENRFGFNTMTLPLWLTDLFKSTAITVVLLSLLVSGAFFLIRWSPGFWWLWVWGFFAAVTIFLMYIAPFVIEPLFYTFSPVGDEKLEEKIRAMMGKAGIQVSRVMQVDASRRSRHSNAYFTGIGKTKRIVLFDTLLKQMSHQEILAVLAHEAGHWKKGHIRKRLMATEAGMLLAAYLAFRLLEWGGLPGLLGIGDVSFSAQLVILAFLGSLAAFFITPLSSGLSRLHERQADAFACELSGTPEALASALIKLSGENLANLHPHPLYAWFYYSHPPIVERVRRLGLQNA